VTSPVFVADFEIGDARPSGRDLVDAAVAWGADFVAGDVVDGEDETPEVHVGGRRVATLARMRSEASRGRLGLFLRLRDTLPIAAMREALGVEKGAPSAASRERLLVAVDGERTGKRLRAEAPELPSALELPVKSRGLARFASPNFQRAGADADDLVVPWGRADVEKLITRIAPILAARGARVWVCGLPETDRPRAERLPVAGLVVRRPL
jgi:hypothetical protein